MRLFIAIDFNEFSEYFKRLQEQLPKAKHTLPKKFHLTLKFLGDVDENKVGKIKQLLSEIKFQEFECFLGDIKYFSGNFIKTIFVKVTDSDKIFELQKEIDNNLLDFFEKAKQFEPHLTIARVKHVENKKEYLDGLQKIKTEKHIKTVNSFELLKSELTPEGPVYEVLEQFKVVSQPL